MIRTLRFRIGRALLQLGLKALPQGRVKAELYALVDQWATKVHNAIQ